MFDVAYGLQVRRTVSKRHESSWRTLDTRSHPIGDDVSRCSARVMASTSRSTWSTRYPDNQRMTMHTFEKLASEGVEPQVSWVSEGYLDELQARG